MAEYRFKVNTTNQDYINVTTGDYETAKQQAMNTGLELHPREEAASGPQSVSAECLYDSVVADALPRCKVDGCNEPILGERTSGLCGFHY